MKTFHSERTASPRSAMSSALNSLRNSWVLQRALAIQEKALPPDHPNTAAILHNQARLYQARGKYDQAEPLFQRALVIYEKALSPYHPWLAACLENYAALLRQLHRQTEAAPLEHRAQVIRDRRLS